MTTLYNKLPGDGASIVPVFGNRISPDEPRNRDVRLPAAGSTVTPDPISAREITSSNSPTRALVETVLENKLLLTTKGGHANKERNLVEAESAETKQIVKFIQKSLNLEVTGEFDDKTKSAVAVFQRNERDLTVDGKVGFRTMQRLLEKSEAYPLKEQPVGPSLPASVNPIPSGGGAAPVLTTPSVSAPVVTEAQNPRPSSGSVPASGTQTTTPQKEVVRGAFTGLNIDVGELKALLKARPDEVVKYLRDSGIRVITVGDNAPSAYGYTLEMTPSERAEKQSVMKSIPSPLKDTMEAAYFGRDALLGGPERAHPQATIILNSGWDIGTLVREFANHRYQEQRQAKAGYTPPSPEEIRKISQLLADPKKMEAIEKDFIGANPSKETLAVMQSLAKVTQAQLIPSRQQEIELHQLFLDRTIQENSVAFPHSIGKDRRAIELNAFIVAVSETFSDYANALHTNELSSNSGPSAAKSEIFKMVIANQQQNVKLIDRANFWLKIERNESYVTPDVARTIDSFLADWKKHRDEVNSQN